MKITVDTNILVRAATGDDHEQAEIARRTLAEAELVAVTLPVMCEYCWVLKTAYAFTPKQISASLRLLIDAGNVAMNREAVEGGLKMLELGGDFADGVIAYEGRWLGGETFMTFDRKALRLLETCGECGQIPE